MEEKSKSERKREMTALQKLGERLAELSPEQLRKFALPQELREALLLARALKSHHALRRQLQYIGVMMRRIDSEQIRKAIDEIDRGQKQKAHAFHQLERMRDRLVEGDDAALTEIVRQFPETDVQKLRQLVRNARKEKQENKTLKQSRTLFRHLRELSEKH